MNKPVVDLAVVSAKMSAAPRVDAAARGGGAAHERALAIADRIVGRNRRCMHRGLCGGTQHIGQMKSRIRLDLHYINNWKFWKYLTPDSEQSAGDYAMNLISSPCNIRQLNLPVA